MKYTMYILSKTISSGKLKEMKGLDMEYGKCNGKNERKNMKRARETNDKATEKQRESCELNKMRELRDDDCDVNF